MFYIINLKYLILILIINNIIQKLITYYIFSFLFLAIFFFILIQESSLLSIHPKKYSSSTLSIYFLDVGEADSTLIRYKDYNVLIDAGNQLDGDKLSHYFKELGIESFDIVIATHPHEDHIGGMAQIIRDFDISSFYMTNISTDFVSYHNMMNELSKKNISTTIPVIDSSFSLDELVFHILSIGDDSNNINDSSIVLKLDFYDTHYLFMSDVSSDIEHSILDKDLHSNVLKVGHHGSNKSSSAHFLYQVDPEYAIISCGLQNDYYHPHQVVLDKLNKISASIYRTDIDHTIHLVSDGVNIMIEKIPTDTNGGDLDLS